MLAPACAAGVCAIRRLQRAASLGLRVGVSGDELCYASTLLRFESTAYAASVVLYHRGLITGNCTIGPHISPGKSITGHLSRQIHNTLCFFNFQAYAYLLARPSCIFISFVSYSFITFSLIKQYAAPADSILSLHFSNRHSLACAQPLLQPGLCRKQMAGLAPTRVKRADFLSGYWLFLRRCNGSSKIRYILSKLRGLSAAGLQPYCNLHAAMLSGMSRLRDRLSPRTMLAKLLITTSVGTPPPIRLRGCPFTSLMAWFELAQRPHRHAAEAVIDLDGLSGRVPL